MSFRIIELVIVIIITIIVVIIIIATGCTWWNCMNFELNTLIKSKNIIKFINHRELIAGAYLNKWRRPGIQELSQNGNPWSLGPEEDQESGGVY